MTKLKKMIVYLYEDGRVSHKPNAGQYHAKGRNFKCIAQKEVVFEIPTPPQETDNG